ncbi:tRNA-queuosine alpha-mannosyltransferase domain-containing protein [Thalassoglobus polymorphus]|uniref:tRNA-queuosine alpha-mannosyltransferase n=1 Tax=Thalassoglobus polymorphus TaxID=2527994 RepID=A0A517QGK8_9PLAN|nr:DUF3524 domain-containing protein [Thalassoglobus polymorphus]QDT30778.1 Glycosyl transferases group 1 [Thalassoglobus polymorphus]
MKILALNPFHSGSHQAFLDGWAQKSRHELTLFTLPGTQWKWRMRHAATSFALQIREVLKAEPQSWDVIFTTDMLNVAELKGQLPESIRSCPVVLYFHENQFEYPTRLEGGQAQRDEHFAFTNFISLLSADQVWFNSNYHRDNLLNHVRNQLSRMPKLARTDAARWKSELEKVEQLAKVHTPGIECRRASFSSDGPIHLCWVGRWEHDKNPEQFFEALRLLRASGVAFQLSVFGESYRNTPECFSKAREEFQSNIVHWGFAESKERYFELLAQADVVVSTAIHEFFGIAILEAMNAGCVPILPQRLSYPELVRDETRFLYDGTTNDLVENLGELAQRKLDSLAAFQADQRFAVKLSQRFEWGIAAEAMDAEIEFLLASKLSDE